MITYIKDLSLDGILLSLGRQLIAETDKMRLEGKNYHYDYFNRVYCDYLKLYRRFMKIDYPFTLLDECSDLYEPIVISNRAKEAIKENFSSSDAKKVISIIFRH